MEPPAVIYQLPRGVRAVIHDPTTDAAGKVAVLERCLATLETRIAWASERQAAGQLPDLLRLQRILARAHEEWRD